MHVIIDGRKLEFTKDDRNLVEVADRAGVGIPAPCYRSKQKMACCNVCVVEIDGKQTHACGTKPVEGMEVTVNSDNLKSLRKLRAREYKENGGQKCDCNSEVADGVSCCT